MVPIILTLLVINQGGHLSNHPTHLRIEFSEYLLARIKKMQSIIKRNKLNLISEYNGEGQYRTWNPKQRIYTNSAYSYEAETLCVTATHFYWKANIKFTETSVRSNGVHFKDLNKIIKIRNLPIIEMPKYINDDNEIIRHLAKLRMEYND